MKVELFPFQKSALANLRTETAEALGSYRRTHTPQIVSYTAPTGAGKTIVMSALIESIFFGDEVYPDQLDAIFVWLSDSPELNQQSKDKIDMKADKIRLDQCVTMITRDSADADIRYMFPIKSSLAPEGCAIGFVFDRNTGFQWIGPCDIDLKAPDEDISYEDNKRAQAASYLTEILNNGHMQSTAVISLLQRKGLSQRTIYTAKKDMGVRSYKKDTVWYWQLPEADNGEDTAHNSKGR